MWIASYDGLVRFDGHQFRVMRRSTEPRLPSNRFTSLATSADGRVWAASEDGDLVHLDRGGTVRAVYRGANELAGRVLRLSRTAGGTWAGTDQGLLLLDEVPRPVSDTSPGIGLDSIGVTRDGTRWMGSPTAGLFHERSGEPPRRVVEPRGPTDAMRVLLVDADTVWVGGTRLLQIQGDVVTPIAGVEAELSDVCDVVRRPDGAIEVRDRHGWWRVVGQQATLVLAAEVPRCLVSPSSAGSWPWRMAGRRVLRGNTTVFEAVRPISTLLAAPDGSVWVATVGEGLVRLRPRLVHAVPAPRGWARPSVESLLVDRNGGVWLGSIIEGLARVEPPHDVALAMKRDDGQAPGVLGLVEAQDGALEVGTDVRLCRLVRDGEAGTSGPSACESMAEGWRGASHEVLVPLLVDHLGRTWFGGLDTWVNGKDALFVHYDEAGVAIWREIKDAAGAPVRGARAAIEAPDGAVFIATAGDGVLRVRDDGVRRLGVADGLASGRIRSVYVDPRNAVWIGTEDAGLCRWNQSSDQVGCLGLAEGLYDDVVHAILPDDAGRLWMSGNHGLSYVRRASLEAVLDGREASALAIGLNERHGMKSREANGGLPQSAAKDALGRLWFATQSGAAWVDPRSVPMPKPPSVELVELRVGGVARSLPLAPGTTARLVSDARSLEVEWSAAAFLNRDDLRFRYRLVGLEAGWRTPTSE